MSWLKRNVLKSKPSRRLAYWITVAVSVVGLILFSSQIGIVQTAGWIYSLAFALSALPQAIKSIEEGHSRGVADGTLLLWMIGEIAGLVYGFGIAELPIIFNCGLNTIFVGIIVWYRLKPKTEKETDML